MKEMVYSKYSGIEILDKGKYKNYDYIIISLGTHPCAYVKVLENHPYYNKEYNECDIQCHGGLTYSENFLIAYPCKEDGVWWLGWDYAHAGDYTELMFKRGNTGIVIKTNESGLIKHTTKEIQQDCFNVIEQLIEIEKQNT